MNKKTVLEQLYQRFACREYDLNKHISLEDFETILEAGRLSPSSYGLEPWHFLVIENESLKEQLKPIAWGAVTNLEQADRFVIILARKNLTSNHQHFNHMLKDIRKLNDETFDRSKKRFDVFQEEDLDLLSNPRYLSEWSIRQTYIALANMMTVASMMGIASCPIEGFNKSKVEALLSHQIDLNEWTVSCMVGFGYALKTSATKTRQALNDLMTYIK